MAQTSHKASLYNGGIMVTQGMISSNSENCTWKILLLLLYSVWLLTDSSTFISKKCRGYYKIFLVFLLYPQIFLIGLFFFFFFHCYFEFQWLFSWYSLVIVLSRCWENRCSMWFLPSVDPFSKKQQITSMVIFREKKKKRIIC